MNYKSLLISLLVVFSPTALVGIIYSLGLIGETTSVTLVVIHIIWMLVVEIQPIKRPNGSSDYIMKCHWCDKEFYTESIRAIHLRRKHPKFFEKYDEMNDWLFTDKIPEKPEGDKNED